MMVLTQVGVSGVGEKGEEWFEIDLELEFTELGDRLDVAGQWEGNVKNDQVSGLRNCVHDGTPYGVRKTGEGTDL